MDEYGKGFGAKVVNSLVEMAKKNNINVVAKRVIPTAENFWQRNGFVRAPEPNPNNDYIYQVEQSQS
ncbi:MAG: GNAT family N-acetyltransferase [Patescibacteria group bacterium]